MSIRSFAENLKRSLAENPLPGADAQYRMASSYYKDKRIKLDQVTNYKKSAVCLLLYENNGEIYFLLIERPDTHTHHAGQLALPGGRSEPGETFEDTALRELEEETGIAIGTKDILGKLSPVYIPASNFYIQPVVACTWNTFNLTESKEVTRFIPFPLRELLDDALVQETEVFTQYEAIIKTPYYNIHGNVVWGATAMILSEMKELVLRNETIFSFLSR